jgi:hypothetical protein
MPEDELEDELLDESESEHERALLQWAQAVDRTLTPWQRLVVAAPRWLALATMALTIGGVVGPLVAYLVGIGPPPPRQYWWYPLVAALLTWIAVNRKDSMLDQMGRPRPPRTGDENQ